MRGRTDVVGVSATAKCSTRATPAYCSLQRPVAIPVKCSISFYRCLHILISDGRPLNLTGKSKVLTNGIVSSDAGEVGSNRCRRLTSVKEHSFRCIQKGTRPRHQTHSKSSLSLYTITIRFFFFFGRSTCNRLSHSRWTSLKNVLVAV